MENKYQPDPIKNNLHTQYCTPEHLFSVLLYYLYTVHSFTLELLNQIICKTRHNVQILFEIKTN